MKYLLVEGITDVSLIKYICLKNRLTSSYNDFKKLKSDSRVDTYRFGEIYIIDLKGQTNLEYVVQEILSPLDSKIKEIGIIQDADNSFESSKVYIENIINNSSIDKVKFSYFLTPNNQENGNLETLLLSTINVNNTILSCFDNYKGCLLKDNAIFPKALDKGKLYAYTMYSQSGQNLYKPHDSFINEETDTNLWDISHPNFKQLIKFIVDLLK